MEVYVDGSIVVGVGAIGVAAVQAFIYWQQKKAQEQANRQGLFDRRYQLYKIISKTTARYISVEGRWLKSEERTALDDAVDEARFVFPTESYNPIVLLREAITRHSEIVPDGEYEPAKGMMTYPESPAADEALERVKAALADLPNHLDVMQLSR